MLTLHQRQQSCRLSSAPLMRAKDSVSDYTRCEECFDLPCKREKGPS